MGWGWVVLHHLQSGKAGEGCRFARRKQRSSWEPTTDRVENPQRIELDLKSPLVSEEKTKVELRPTKIELETHNGSSWI